MCEKINIVHLIPLMASGGGAERVVHDLCRGMDRTRFSVTLLYWKEPGDLAEQVKAAGTTVVRLSLKKVLSLPSVASIAREIRRSNGTLLHTHFMDADLLGFAAAKCLRIPQVVSVHSFPFPEHPRHAWRYRLMSGGLARIVGVSSMVRDNMRRRTGIGSSTFRVVYNGLDVDVISRRADAVDRQALRASLGLLPDDVVIGNVSRLVPDKGHEFLLRAMPSIFARFPKVKVLIVGDGFLRESLAGLSRSLGLGDRVVFAGKRTDVPELLGIMDVFVFPTFMEAFGLCVLEAMAAGKPLIATNDAAVPELIRDGQEGILIPPGDAGAIAGALEKLLPDDALRLKLGERARQRSGDFRLDRMVRGYEQVYSEVLKR